GPLNSCSCAFCSVSVLQRTHLIHPIRPLNAPEVASEFFRTNAPNPANWTLNTCFGVFRSVSVHSAMFNYYTKLGAKWVELVQLMDKFVPLSRIGNFHNECTRSTPLDPKLKYWFVSYCLGAFWICFV